MTGRVQIRTGSSLLAAATRLRAGDEVRVRPRGQSMTPHIRSGQEVALRPLEAGEKIKRGTIVLARVKGRLYLHFAVKTATDGSKVLIGPAHGRSNGWTSRENVFGVLTGTRA